MSSTIFYRFRSQKNTSRIQFDGTGLTVFDLKKEIISENKLGDGTGFELRVYNADTNEEYADDTLVIPRSSSVVARRSPPNKPGKGGASRYVTGKPRITKVTLNSNTSGKPALSTIPSSGDTEMTEEERINAMFANQSDQWKQTQQEMANAAPVYTARPQPAAGASTGTEDVPPPGYVCYRCGSKEHFIKNCPTNDDPNWEGKRIKRTTGIPKTLLKTVEKPGDDTSKTYLMNEEGKYFIQVADEKTWETYRKKVDKASEFDSLKDADPDLLDPVTGKVMEDPVVTPCCDKSYSRRTIEESLLQSDFVCPNCGKDEILLDQLKSDEDKKNRIDELLEKERERRGIKRPFTSGEENDAKRLNAGPLDSAAGLPPIPGMIPMMMAPPFPFPPGFVPPVMPSQQTNNQGT